MANNLIQLKYNWFKLACLFVFLNYNFHLSSAIVELFLSHGKEIIWFLVSRLDLYKSSSLFFSIVFSNVSRYSTIKDILLHVVSFCPLKSIINSCLYIQFSWLLWDILSHGKEIIFTYWLSRRAGRETIWLEVRADRAQRGPYLLTESQIFSRPARPYSVNKHFIIWQLAVENFENSVWT